MYLKVPHNSSNCLNNLLGSARLLQHTGRHLLNNVPRSASDVNVFPVEIVPGAANDEGDVVGEVEECGDED